MKDGPDDRDVEVIPSEEELMAGLRDIELTPQEHQRVKEIVHGERFAALVHHDRRYLVVGAGGDTDSAKRRAIVVDLLDGRTSPPSIAVQLEDFEIDVDDMRLWSRVFDILCGTVTCITAVIEDFDGGYVWELGLLFAPSYREKVWVLKRHYRDEDTERMRYRNAMAASHVELLLTGDRAQEWVNEEELREAVERIP